MAIARSLADDLRARTDEQLAALVRARPDLIHPVPSDVAELAARAGSPGSISARIRDLDQMALYVLLAAALAEDPTDTTSLILALADLAPRAAITSVVTSLHADALLWGTTEAMHVVGPARDLLVPIDRGPRLSALDPAVAALAADPSRVHALVGQAPNAARGAMERLIAGPVVGTLPNARRTPDPERGGVDWLLAHRLVVPMGSDRVVVPAEIVDILRNTASGDAPADAPATATPSLAAPAPGQVVTDPVARDRSAVGAALDLVHAVEALGHLWAQRPPAPLRSGGIGLRDLTLTARALGHGDQATALIIEVASAAGLVALDRDEPLILPTDRFDLWLISPPGSRLADLWWAWRDMARLAPRPGEHPLAATGAAAWAPSLRRAVLAALAGSGPPGVDPCGDWTDDELVGALHWHAPRRRLPDQDIVAQHVLAEARALGLLVRGALTSAGQALTRDDRDATAAAAGAHLPEQVDRMILQGDLTAIVPGLPSAGLAALLRLAADRESAGAASVHRFSEASLRRALDTGRSSDQLLAELGAHGTVPQPLAYLIGDIARKHATLRIGSAATYLRCDDPSALTVLLADPRLAGLALVRLSDTVLVASEPAELVTDRLSELGARPTAEGNLASARPTGPRRAHARRVSPEQAGQAGPQTPRSVPPALAAAAIRAIRAHDRGPTGSIPTESPSTGAASAGAAPSSPPVPVQPVAEVSARLRAAMDDEAVVWLGYSDTSGVTSQRRVQPLHLAGGYLTALDLRTETITTLALARITGVEDAG